MAVRKSFSGGGRVPQILKFKLTPEDHLTLTRLQIKIKEDYIPLTQALLIAVPDSLKMRNILELFQRTLKGIGKLLSGRLLLQLGIELWKETKADLTNIGDALEFLKRTRDESPAFKQIGSELSGIEFELDKKFETITGSWGSVEKEVSGIKPTEQGLFESLRGISPEGYNIGKSILTSGLEGLLGPFAPLLMAGGKAAYSGIRGLHRNLTGHTGRLQGALTPQIGESGLGDSKNLAKLAKKALATPLSPRGLSSLFTGGVQQSEGKLQGQQLERATDPMNNFFDRGALKAGWTSRVLRALDQISGNTDELEVKTSKSLMPILPAITAAIGAGMLATKMSGILSEVNPRMAKALNLFNMPGIPGISLRSGYDKGPGGFFSGSTNMANAYADLGEKLIGVVGPMMSKMVKNVPGYDLFESGLGRLGLAIKPVTDGISAFSDAIWGVIDGMVSMVPASIRTKVIPAAILNRTTVTDVIKDSVKDGGKSISKGDSDKTMQTIQALASELSKMTTVLQDTSKQQSKDINKVISNSGSRDVVVYGQKNPAIDGVNAGTHRVAR